MTLTELLEYKNQTRNSTHEAFDRLDGQSNKKVGRTKKTEKFKAKGSKIKSESLKFFTIKAENAKCKVLLNLR